jgi:hypothetical protein
MIALGCVTTDERQFRSGAMVAIESVAERDSLLMRRWADGAPAARYDEMLAEAVRHDDLEAIVLLDQAVRAVDSRLLECVRGHLVEDRGLALIVPQSGRSLVVLSNWAARHLRCDPTAGRVLGALALDLGLQARDRERHVVVSDVLDAVADEHLPVAQDVRRDHVLATAAVCRRWGRSALTGM